MNKGSQWKLTFQISGGFNMRSNNFSLIKLYVYNKIQYIFDIILFYPLRNIIIMKNFDLITVLLMVYYYLLVYLISFMT